MKATRGEVYAAIDGERDYQDSKWAQPAHRHSPEEFLVYMEHYIAKAKALASTLDFQVSGERDKCLAEIRKVTALGVACMEQNGAPRRVGCELRGTPIPDDGGIPACGKCIAERLS